MENNHHSPSDAHFLKPVQRLLWLNKWSMGCVLRIFKLSINNILRIFMKSVLRCSRLEPNLEEPALFHRKSNQITSWRPKKGTSSFKATVSLHPGLKTLIYFVPFWQCLQAEKPSCRCHIEHLKVGTKPWLVRYHGSGCQTAKWINKSGAFEYECDLFITLFFSFCWA